VRLIFKDVGQGDSIILEWHENEVFKLGIIDASNETGKNPVLEHLKAISNYSIEFILLTHPHSDHFSGLLEVLEYISIKDIKVNYLLHTCSSVEEYFKASVRGRLHKKVLEQIFQLASKLNESGAIENFGPVTTGVCKDFYLTDDVVMKVLSPTNSFYNKYNQVAFKNESEKNNNPDANYLSVVLKIEAKDWFILLTADAPRDFFWNVNKKGYKEFNKKFSIGQVPHHGSKNNYYPAFWKAIQKDEGSFAIFSVGENYYNHPSSSTVESLQTLKYQIKATNYIGSLGSSLKVKEDSLLDLISTLEMPAAKDAVGADVVFQLRDNQWIVE